VEIWTKKWKCGERKNGKLKKYGTEKWIYTRGKNK